MKRRFGLLAVMFTLCAAPAFAEDAPKTYPGPQEAASNIYTQLFENEKVRVSEIKFNPGDKAPMHTHPYDHFVYVIEPGQLTITKADGTSMVKDATAGEVIWMGAETHEAVNTGQTTLRALVSESKA